MPPRQLNIRSDEAAERARRLADALGRTTTRVVEDALREYEERVVPRDDRGMTAEQRRRFDKLQTLAKETAKHVIPGSPSDHDWLYDERGLPK